MIRNLMLAAGLFTFTAGSALAGTQRTQKVANEAPAAGETEKAPKAKKPRKSKKVKAAEGEPSAGTSARAR